MLSLSAAEARSVARAVLSTLIGYDSAMLRRSGIDLEPAFEQVLFTTLRAGERRQRHWLRDRLEPLRPFAATATAMRPTPPPQRADVLTVYLAGVHRQLFDPVRRALASDHASIAVTAVRAHRAAEDSRLSDVPSVNRLVPPWTFLPLLRAGDDAQFRRALHAALSDVGLDGRDRLVPLLSSARGRLAIEGIRLDAAVRAVRPGVVVMYDEIDAWGRLLTTVAHARGIAALDLPHAEAYDVEGTRGVAYDRMAVFGHRAAEILRLAGIGDNRIAVVGAARFDLLVRRPWVAMESPPRVVMAGQYRGRLMTDAVRLAILRAAAEAAATIGGYVQLRPHPLEASSAWDPLMAEVRTSVPAEIHLEPTTELHDLLPGAAVLVTGWSNSVYEAVIAGVPAITVHVLDGPPPMPFAQERIALQAHTSAEAAQLAARLVIPSERAAVLEAARLALPQHLGPLDGRAAERTAAVLAEMARP